jgi:hypothetical protein
LRRGSNHQRRYAGVNSHPPVTLVGSEVARPSVTFVLERTARRSIDVSWRLVV